MARKQGVRRKALLAKVTHYRALSEKWGEMEWISQFPDKDKIATLRNGLAKQLVSAWQASHGQYMVEVERKQRAAADRQKQRRQEQLKMAKRRDVEYIAATLPPPKLLSLIEAEADAPEQTRAYFTIELSDDLGQVGLGIYSYAQWRTKLEADGYVNYWLRNDKVLPLSQARIRVDRDGGTFPVAEARPGSLLCVEHRGNYAFLAQEFLAPTRWLILQVAIRKKRAQKAYLAVGESPEEARELSWTILPPGWWADRRWINAVGKNSATVGLEVERIENIISLGPLEMYRSSKLLTDHNYHAFLFPDAVVAESPLEGNAIYILHGTNDWKRLLSLSKRELLNREPKRVVRIVHTGDWQSRLRHELEQ